MSYYEAPRVERATGAGVDVWSLRGDWTRDLPLEVRRAAAAELGDGVGSALIIDLANVSFVDSWGAETFCDAVQRVLEQGKVVAWVLDATRRTYLEGFERALARRHLVVPKHGDVPSAMAAVKRRP